MQGKIIQDQYKIQSTNDFEILAKNKLPPQVYGYFASGAQEGVTLKQNIKIFSKIGIFTKPLLKTVSLSNFQLNTTILGHKMKLPFGFAPSAMHKLAHQKGEQMTSSVAGQNGICLGISNLSTVSLSKIQSVNKDGLKLLQLYILNDKSVTETLIRIAQKNGFKGLIITVDAQVPGKRSTDGKQKLFQPKHLKFQVVQQIQNSVTSLKNTHISRQYIMKQRDLSLNWNIISWLRSITNLPIILKGIMSLQDAITAAKLNVDAVWISNHGARQLDGVSSTLELLPYFSQAVKSISKKTQVYIDGGIRTGQDIFKCLALGADYVFVGRLVIYSLAVNKLNQMVTMLKQDLIKSMANAGVSKIQDISSQLVYYRQRQPKL